MPGDKRKLYTKIGREKVDNALWEKEVQNRKNLSVT